MLLQHGEVIVGSENIPWALGLGAAERVSGVLHLTNRRLVFEAMLRDHTGGFAPKTLVDLDLAYITNAVAFQPSRKEVALRIEAGPHYACTFATANAAAIAQSIYQSRTKLVAERATQRAQTPATAASPPQPASSQRPMVFLHCRHCGALNDPGSRHCMGCGATL
jgi:hypothetical protein